MRLVFFRYLGLCGCLGENFANCVGHYLKLALLLSSVIHAAKTDTSASFPDDENNYIARLNYGATAVKLQPVCVVDGYWSHAFHLRLPTPNAQSVPPVACRRKTRRRPRQRYPA